MMSELSKSSGGTWEVFNDLVPQLSPKLYAIIWRYVNDKGETEAVVQEAWLRAWRHRDELDFEESILPWLIKTAINITRDLHRKKRPVDFSDLDYETYQEHNGRGDIDQWLDQLERIESLTNAVRTLRPEYRLVIALRYESEMSYEEISKTLDLSINTVRTHLRRAKIELRELLELSDERSIG